MKKGTKEKVTLGSGMLYMAEFAVVVRPVKNSDKRQLLRLCKCYLCRRKSRFFLYVCPYVHLFTPQSFQLFFSGWIKGGASIEYKPTMTQEKDDLGHVVKAEFLPTTSK